MLLILYKRWCCLFLKWWLCWIKKSVERGNSFQVYRKWTVLEVRSFNLFCTNYILSLRMEVCFSPSLGRFLSSSTFSGFSRGSRSRAGRGRGMGIAAGDGERSRRSLLPLRFSGSSYFLGSLGMRSRPRSKLWSCPWLRPGLLGRSSDRSLR